MTTKKADDLRARDTALGLHGLAARWDELSDTEWVAHAIGIEEQERQRRSLERRVKRARLGAFKPMADFDWGWPTKIDRELVDELFTLQFIDEAANVVLVGPNGVGKSMIARNLAHAALMAGHTVHFTSASEMLNRLAAQDSMTALERHIRRLCKPNLLVIDEVGYLSYGNRHADLLFEVVTRRHLLRPVVLTTNKPFAEWAEVFPNATCVVTLVDRLVHRAEIVAVEAESYRLKEAKERSTRKAKERAARKRSG